MHEALRALLLADAGVSALVGTRVTWGARPQGSALPAVVLHLISDVPGYTLAGDNGHRDSRVQADCIGEGRYEAVLGVAQAVQAALSGYSGTVAGTIFQGIFIDQARDLSEPAVESERRLFHLSTDFLIHHLEE
ncbi:MAG TPA: DUF3168 domain-containing protein [Amaricoccus sp.]|mgnify:CR=1 FL=1|uniref:tail completion protein gp17 n=1 Tax=Amaricoccus sp. TaxID=1872485 RepID=UPI002C1DC03E|nr:DUF3168 domain-containing protein [Amaricoccus sp.]HMR51187.1 DUF3168 domain-containing protein [Amaricoccus sp.]HMT98065.1 DUF3168 domain-containing protein [Amaricoccus sp.]